MHTNRRTSDSYHDYLIKVLKDPEESAAYLEAALEEDNSEPKLLRKALSNVIEALGGDYLTPEQIKLHREKLDQLLARSGGDVLYGLVTWLNALGLKLTVVTDEQAKDKVEALERLVDS